MDMTKAEVKDQPASESKEKEAPPPESIEEQFESDSYSRNLLSSHMKLRCDGCLCDVTIRFGNFEIKAHRIILASATEYFKAMFMNETKEAKTGIINFPKIPSEVVKKCIEFIYSGKVKISMETVQSLLDIAEMMQLPELCELCINFLAKSINIANCSEIITLSCLYCKISLDSPIKKFLMENFEEFSKTEDFSALDLQPVAYCMDLVRDNSPQQEKLIWDAIVAWVEHDYDGRKGLFDLLFESVELSCFSKTFVRETILSQPLVIDCNASLRKLALFNATEQLPPGFDEPKAYFYHHGGSQVILQYEVQSGKWSSVLRFPWRIPEYADAISHRGCVYVGDGRSLYKLSKGVWSKTEMTVNVQGAKFVFNRCVAVGGIVYMVTLDNIYEYDTSQSTFNCHEVNVELSSTFITMVSQHSLYIFSCGSEKKAFAFDLKTKKFSRLCNMLSEWSSRHVAATWHDSKIYVFCHTFLPNAGWVNRVECYAPDMDIWGIVENLKPLQKPLSVLISGSNLYIFHYNLNEKCQTIDLDKLKSVKVCTAMKKCFTASG